MSTMTVPAGEADELDLLQTLMGSLADTDPTELAQEEVARRLRVLEQVDAMGAAARGRLLEVFDAHDGPVADGQRTARAWLVHVTRVTRGQAAEHRAVQALARQHPVLLAALAEGWVVTKSEALQLAKWTRLIPDEYRTQAEEILVAAARAGADLRSLAAICAEIRSRRNCSVIRVTSTSCDASTPVPLQHGTPGGQEIAQRGPGVGPDCQKTKAHRVAAEARRARRAVRRPTPGGQAAPRRLARPEGPGVAGDPAR
jgi:hypothetical protein